MQFSDLLSSSSIRNQLVFEEYEQKSCKANVLALEALCRHGDHTLRTLGADGPYRVCERIYHICLFVHLISDQLDIIFQY